MELLLSGSLTSTVVNSGQFQLGAQWWDGDPFAGGSFVEDAPATVRSYEATAMPAVPEPSSISLILFGLGGVIVGCCRKR